MNIDGANRRTADVRSVGYSELFSLSKEDVLEGCRDYPEAERKLYEYAQHRLGFEKAKKEAADKMKGAFSTLTSIASCLSNNKVKLAAADGTSPSPLALSTIQETNERTSSNNEHEIDNESEQKSSVDRVTNLNCDSQDKVLLYQSSISNQFPLIASSRGRTNDLMTEIELLVNDKLVGLDDCNIPLP